MDRRHRPAELAAGASDRHALPADPITVAQYIRYLVDRPTREVPKAYKLRIAPMANYTL